MTKAKIRIAVINYYDVEIDSEDWGEHDFSEVDLEEVIQDYEILGPIPDDAEYGEPAVWLDGRWQKPILCLRPNWQKLENDDSWHWHFAGTYYDTLNDFLREHATSDTETL